MTGFYVKYNTGVKWIKIFSMQHNIVNIIIILAAANIMSRQSKALFTKKNPLKSHAKNRL